MMFLASPLWYLLLLVIKIVFLSTKNYGGGGVGPESPSRIFAPPPATDLCCYKIAMSHEGYGTSWNTGVVRCFTVSKFTFFVCGFFLFNKKIDELLRLEILSMLIFQSVSHVVGYYLHLGPCLHATESSIFHHSLQGAQNSRCSPHELPGILLVVSFDN